MKQLPDTVKPFKKTPTFSESTVPAGLLKDHNTAAGVWGVIKVVSGCINYQITEGSPFQVTLDLDTDGIIEPRIKHHLEVCGPVSFYVEFNR